VIEEGSGRTEAAREKLSGESKTVLRHCQKKEGKEMGPI
jgi:hypothetical protein